MWLPFHTFLSYWGPVFLIRFLAYIPKAGSCDLQSVQSMEVVPHSTAQDVSYVGFSSVLVYLFKLFLPYHRLQVVSKLPWLPQTKENVFFVNKVRDVWSTPGCSGNFSDISVWRDIYTLRCRRCDKITKRTQEVSCVWGIANTKNEGSVQEQRCIDRVSTLYSVFQKCAPLILSRANISTSRTSYAIEK
jgi:hypothetical protein